MDKLVVYWKGTDDLNNPIYRLFGYHSNVHSYKIIFDYDIDLLEENYTDICSSGLNLANVEKEFLTNKVDLINIKKGFFEKFFNLFG